MKDNLCNTEQNKTEKRIGKKFQVDITFKENIFSEYRIFIFNMSQLETWVLNFKKVMLYLQVFQNNPCNVNVS